MEVDGRIIAAVALIPTRIATAFSVFLFMDSRHAHPPDVVEAEARLVRKVAMSDSTRYAELIHHYTEVQKKRPLTEAEEARLDLARRMQMRLHESLVE